MNILVTGGSGFIGTILVQYLLEQNHNVVIYDKVKSKKFPHLVHLGDVRDKESLIKACEEIDIIYNLAAEHADNVTPTSLYSDVNIGGAENVIAAAEKNNIRKIIFTSSVAIYGLNRGTPDETFDAQPFNEYGRTKFEAEKVLIKWAKKSQDNSLTIVRPAVIFGENNRGNVYNLIDAINKNKFIMIGKGHNKKSMGYVKNIALFLASLVNKENGIFIYNYADKPDLTSKQIVNIIQNELNKSQNFPPIPYFLGLLGGYAFDLVSIITGKKFSISSVRIKKFSADTTINTDRLYSTGFKPKYTLEEGLRNMIRYDFK